jgi:hypothetical protein
MPKGFLKRRSIAFAAVLGVVAALAIPMAFADSPHFIGTPTCTKNADFSLTCSGKAAGLGNSPTGAFLTSSDVSGTIQCQNNGGNFPPPKGFDFGPLTGQTQNITPHNGVIKFSPTIGPPPLPNARDFCPNGKTWRVVIITLTYNDVVLHIQQGGVDLLTFDFGNIDP